MHAHPRTWRIAAAQLVDEAFRRWLLEEDGVVDDVTAVVVHLNHTYAALE